VLAGPWMNRGRLAVALALAALCLGSATARASVTVTTTTDEMTANADCSLREAITLLDGDDPTNRGCTNTAADPTTINVPAKTDPYMLTIHGTANDTNTTGDLDVYRDMTIAGAGATGTVIDGDNADRVFDVFRYDTNPSHDQDPTVTISGVTITNGHAPSQAGVSANGGGIEVYNSSSSLTLNSDVVTDNGAGSEPGQSGGLGGGIYCAGPLTVNSTTIDHNFAGPAGGADKDGGSGGGINCGALLNVTASTIAANGAGNGGSTSGSGGSGGGIYTGILGGTITASTISNNGAGTGHNNDGGYGGGVIGTLTVTNSTIANNEAGDSVGGQAGGGGGMYDLGGTLTNDTIVGNAAGSGIGGGSSNGTGGGIHQNAGHIANTIIASNGIGGNCELASFTDDGHNLALSDSTCPGFTVGDPNLGPLQDNGGPTKTMAISAPSAALDQLPSTGASCAATDQRGLARPQGLACDIGAFELVKRYAVSATKTGTGSGSISSAPASIDCGPICQGQFDQGTEVTLTATADPGSSFAGWSGGGCSGTGPCTFTASADTTVIAAFKDTPATGAPNTKIGKAKIDSDAGTAKFTFGTTAKARAGSGFQCALVSKKHKKPKFKDCTSPKKYKHLKPGKYKFEVRAFDDAGTDSTPAKKKFKIA
jgi:CSLREA domain-containing protein